MKIRIFTGFCILNEMENNAKTYQEIKIFCVLMIRPTEKVISVHVKQQFYENISMMIEIDLAFRGKISGCR